MSHASFSYDAGDVKKEKVVFPVPRIWDRRMHLFLMEDLSLRQNMHNGESLEIEEDCLRRFNESTPAPPDATVTLRITAGDGSEETRVMWCEVEKTYYLLFKDGGRALSLNGPFEKYGVGHVMEEGCVGNENCKPLPPGTVTTIKFYNDPTREKRIDVEVEEPKDWLSMSFEDVGGAVVEMHRENFGKLLCIGFSGGQRVGPYRDFDIKGATEFRDHLDRWISERKAIESAEAAQ